MKQHPGYQPYLQYRFPLFIALAIAFVVIFLNLSIDPNSIPEEDLYSLERTLIKSEIVYQRYVQHRGAYVNGHPELINPWKPFTYLFDYFLPAFSCPHTLQRIGKIGDGGKWVCGFELFESSNVKDVPPCIVYSFGVNGESSFEAEFLSRTNCKIYGYDASVNGMGPEIPLNFEPKERVNFQKTFLGNVDRDNFKTLGTIMNENGHDWIDILKVDIEGSEFPSLNHIMNQFPDGLPFGQIHLEIHAGENSKEFANLYRLWERLEEAGLRPFMKEINLSPTILAKRLPTVCEYSFLNLKNKRNRLVQIY